MDEGKGVFLKDTKGQAAGQVGIANSSSDDNGFHVSNHKLMTNSNGSKEEVDSSNGTALPVNLTTPPLTPPREHFVGEPPMNVNRNNVSDSVHVKATRFSTTIRQGPVLGNGVPRDQCLEGHRQNGGPVFVASHMMDTEPPALVIATNDEPQEEAAADQQGVAIGEESQVAEERDESRSQEVISWNNAQRKSTEEIAPLKARAGNCQPHLASRTVEQDNVSSEEEDIEEMDLVLVEDEEDEVEEERRTRDREAQFGTRNNNGIKSMEAESSTPSYPQSSNEKGHIMSAGVSAATPPSNWEMNSRNRDSERVSTGSRHPEVAHTTNNFVKTGLGEHDHHSRAIGNMTPAVSSESSDREVMTRQASPSENGGNRGGDDGKKEGVVVSDTSCSRRAAKVKQFFSTIQQCANGLGREVAEQVQELIHAVLNETATAEEFHQEIQTVTNYPLKAFTIPFIKENIKYLQAELKDSSQALSDILGTVPASSTVALTPQADEDDELPVLPSSSKSMTLPTIRTVSSSIIHNNSPSSKAANPATTASSSSSSSFFSTSSSASSTLQTSSIVSRSIPSQSAPSNQVMSPSLGGSGTIVQARSHPATSSAVTVIGAVDDGFESVPRIQGIGAASVFPSRKRLRKLSVDKGTSTIGDAQGISSDMQVQGPIHSWPKRNRSEIEGMVIVNNPRPPTSFPHPPPPPPPTTHIVSAALPTRPSSADKQMAYSPFPPQEHHGNRRRGNLLSEDWGHLDMMLNSVQGMVERTRQSMGALKDRVHSTHAEMERKEVDHDHIIQQRVAEAVEKTRRQANEERQRLLVEANKQVRDAVSTVRVEMEQKVQQAQAAAVLEALKEANVQTSSKENCWNCGRRATETCSGCNKARYCGAFCQHKDWANHMHHCASGIPNQSEETVYSGGREPARSQHHHQVTVSMPTGDMTLASANRAMVGGVPHHRAVAIPVSLIGRTQDRTALRLSQHPEIIIKSEKT